MGAGQSGARSADLAVLVEFDGMEEADGFMAVDLPKRRGGLRITDAEQDGDIVRFNLHIDSVSTGRLRAAKRALVRRWGGRAFVRLNGRYTAWHSRKLRGMICESGA